MVSRRSRACSKLGASSSAGVPRAAGAGVFLFAGMVLSGAHRFDAGIRLAARELDRDELSQGEIGRDAKQGTVGPPHKAISAFHHLPRRERAQPVRVAREADA